MLHFTGRTNQAPAHNSFSSHHSIPQPVQIKHQCTIHSHHITPFHRWYKSSTNTTQSIFISSLHFPGCIIQILYNSIHFSFTFPFLPSGFSVSAHASCHVLPLLSHYPSSHSTFFFFFSFPTKDRHISFMNSAYKALFFSPFIIRKLKLILSQKN